MAWRMPKPCENCPFNRTGPGARLRRSLRPGRFAEIQRGLLAGEYFECHKTVEYDEEDSEPIPGSGKLCAGAIAYQEQRGVSSNFQRVCENLDHLKKERVTR